VARHQVLSNYFVFLHELRVQFVVMVLKFPHSVQFSLSGKKCGKFVEFYVNGGGAGVENGWQGTQGNDTWQLNVERLSISDVW